MEHAYAIAYGHNYSGAPVLSMIRSAMPVILLIAFSALSCSGFSVSVLLGLHPNFSYMFFHYFPVNSPAGSVINSSGTHTSTKKFVPLS